MRAMDNHLTVRQAAELLGCSTRTIQGWVHAGLFPGTFKLNPEKHNSPYRIPAAAVQNFQNRRIDNLWTVTADGDLAATGSADK